jgi:hypothetical protein
VSVQSRQICYAVKKDEVGPSTDVRMIEYAVRRLRQEDPPELRDLFTPDAVLVPVPGSAPLRLGERHQLWVPRRLCEALRAEGFGRTVLPCLERIAPVQRSAAAPVGGRPRPRTHRDSLRVNVPVDPPRRLLLVDDVVTKGATLLAAASLLQEAVPGAEVSCFALLRTLGLVREIDRIVAPVRGMIRCNAAGEAEREP